MVDVKEIKKEFGVLQEERRTWDSLFQVLGKYISLIKQNFENTQTPGEFLLDDIFDGTSAFAAHNSASALIGMLWPGTAKQTIEFAPPKTLEMTKELSEFYQRMTDKTIAAMDDPAANLALSLDEYMLDEVIFGTAGIGVERGHKSKLLYKPYGVKEMYIEEGRSGSVDTVYLLFEWRVKRIVDEYGIDAVSPKIREKFEKGKTTDKCKILIAIRPRMEAKSERGVLSMPYESLHIDFESDHLIKESGFEEMPIMVGRLRKLNYERYGRSFGSMALPDIREANALREAVIVATEKILNMPKGILNDGMLGGGVIDMSAGAMNVFNAPANIGGTPPIFDIGSPPNLPWAEQRLQKLEDTIARHFSVDRLLDFNSETEMTFGEAQIRNQIRNQSLSSLFSRQITEVLTPLVARSVAILFRDGEFGVIAGSEEEVELLERGTPPNQIEYVPDVIADRLERGEDIYTVVYKTQAANASRAEEYMGILDVTNYALQGMQIDPSLQHRFDLHEALKNISDIRGLPVGVVRQDDEVAQRIEAQQRQEQEAQGMMAAEQMAGAAKDVAAAQKLAKEAQE